MLVARERETGDRIHAALPSPFISCMYLFMLRKYLSRSRSELWHHFASVHQQAINQPVQKVSEARKGDENGRVEEKAEADEEGHLERRRNHHGEWTAVKQE